MQLLEYFKDYHGFQISNCGRVITPRGREAKQRVRPKGYRMVTITVRGKAIGEMVHRLVAKLFVDSDMPLLQNQVDHIDGNPANNHADNLRWVTGQENIDAKYALRRRLGFRYTPKEEAAQENIINTRGRQVTLSKSGIVRTFRSYGEASRFLGRKRCVKEAIRDHVKSIRGWTIVSVGAARVA